VKLKLRLSKTGDFVRSHYAGKIYFVTSSHAFGAIAQLGERIVRNDEVVGSIPTSSTKFWLNVFNSLNRAAFVLYNFCTTELTQDSQHLS
jgi:hypothetical protein